MQAQNKYIPGVCNIGESEIRKRKQVGWIGLILTFLIYILFVYYNVPRIWHLVIAIPATASAIGFLQARMHFCAYFASTGVFNFGPGAGNTGTVEIAEFRAHDRRKATRIIIYSIIIGMAVAIMAYYLPL